MSLGIALIIIGIVCALLLHWALGVVLIVVGAVLLIAPVMRS